MQNIPTPRYRLAICMAWISVYCQMFPQSLFCCSQLHVPKQIYQYPCKCHLFPILTKWQNLVKDAGLHVLEWCGHSQKKWCPAIVVSLCWIQVCCSDCASLSWQTHPGNAQHWLQAAAIQGKSNDWHQGAVLHPPTTQSSFGNPIPNSQSVTKKRKKRAKEEMRLLWGSIWPFCIKSQNGPIKPWATNSTLFFSFLLSFTCSAAHVASPPLEALPSITEVPKLLQVVTGANVSQKLATFCYFHPSTLLAPYSHLHCLAHILVSCGQLFIIHGWLLCLVDSYLMSMADLILQLLCHCSNSTWIFPITHKQQ